MPPRGAFLQNFLYGTPRFIEHLGKIDFVSLSQMVAMSMADGFARLTGKPQCVLVHVDVGTQMLGCAMHNASVARCPVLVFAGLSPFTLEGEMRGSRTEYIHWLQDAPDQKQIVAQYCRYTAEIKTGKNIKQMVNRALQFATSDPKGPSYLVGAREVMEEVITPYHLDLDVWTNVAPAALPSFAVEEIVSLLTYAQNPLIITGYSGRNYATVPQLVTLVESIPGVRVLDALGSDVCFPYTHRSFLGVRIGRDQSITDADVILVIDCDVPWIPTQCQPRKDSKVVHIDVDPLKSGMAVQYIPAFRRYRADSETALRQLNAFIASTDEYRMLPETEPYASRWVQLAKSRDDSLRDIANRAAPPRTKTDPPSASYLCSELRGACPKDTIWCVEAVTNAMAVYDQLQVDKPGHLVNGGGGGLGWSGGGTLGVKLASDWMAGGTGRGSFVCAIVGDGTFLFGVPGTAYWIAMRYKIPTLTIVLSNKGGFLQALPNISCIRRYSLGFQQDGMRLGTLFPLCTLMDAPLTSQTRSSTSRLPLSQITPGSRSLPREEMHGPTLSEMSMISRKCSLRLSDKFRAAFRQYWKFD